MTERSRILPQSSSEPSLLVVIGLAVFTMVVVTTRFGIAEVGIIIALLGLLARPQSLTAPAPFWWAMALVAWALVTSPWAISPALAQQTCLDRLKVFVVFLVVINALRSWRYLRRYALFIVLCFMLYPARGTIINYLTGNKLAGRAIWNQIYSNPNDLGAMALLAFGLALSILAVRDEKRWAKVCAIFAATSLLAIILLTQSRGVFIGLILGMGPAFLGSVRKRPAVTAGVVIMLALGSTLIPDTVWTRLSGIGKLTSTATIAQADPEGSAAQRWEISKTGFRILEDHALVGVGLGCYSLANARYAPKLGRRDTHDTYLNIAAELGLPGLVLWLGVVLSVLRRWWRSSRSQLELPVQIVWLERAILGFLVAGFFGTYSGITMLYLMLGILWSGAMLVDTPKELRAS